jgi:hypothetical protein
MTNGSLVNGSMEYVRWPFVRNVRLAQVVQFTASYAL